MLGSLSASLWSMLSNILRISISLRVKCMSPSRCKSNEASVGLESEGDDIVAAMSAAIAALSFGGLLGLPEESPLSSSVFCLSFCSLAVNISFKNCGVSTEGNSGSLSSEKRAATVFIPSEAVSNASVTVS